MNIKKMLLSLILLLMAGTASGMTENQANQAFIKAVKADNPDIKTVKELLDKGANVNAKDNDGTTALHIAVDYGNLEMVKLLIKKGANFNAKDINGYTALHHAASNGDMKMVDLLINEGADVNATHDSGYTALHVATPRGNLEMVKFLIKKGADANAKAQEGYTVLPMAQEFGYNTIAAYFQAFSEGLKQFLAGQKVSVEVDNKTLDNELFETHIENALKSENYNTKLIEKYKQLKAQKKMLEKTKDDQFSDLIIFAQKSERK